ncbi:AF4/FMR2 family member 1-like, partial [Nothobranchius furzeri]
QMKDLQTPAAADENETSPVPQMLNDGPIPDETYTQVFTVQGFSLVDYPDSDETDEEVEPLTSHLDIGPDVSDHLYDSDESVVKETCNEASPSNQSNKQLDDELVPPLRRTKSILMDRVQDLHGGAVSGSESTRKCGSESSRERGSESSRESGSESSKQRKSKPRESGSRSSKQRRGKPVRQSKSKHRESGSESTRESGSDSSRESGSESSRESGNESSRESGSESSKQRKSKPRESGSKSSKQRRGKPVRQSKSKPRESGSKSSSERRGTSSSQSKSQPRKSGSESSSLSQFYFSKCGRLERSHDPTQRFPNSTVDGNEKEVATYSGNNVSMPMEEEHIIVSPTLKKDDGSRSYNKNIFAFIAGSLSRKCQDTCGVDTKMNQMLRKPSVFLKTQRKENYNWTIYKIREILNTTVRFWKHKKDYLSYGDNRKKNQRDINLHIVFTAMGCSPEERCGGISRSVASNPKVLNQVKLEFKHCVLLLNHLHRNIQTHIGSS